MMIIISGMFERQVNFDANLVSTFIYCMVQAAQVRVWVYTVFFYGPQSMHGLNVSSSSMHK